MTDFVRVKLQNGSEATLDRGFAESKGLDILDKPAVDQRGEALSAKHRVELKPASDGSAYGGMKAAELQAEADSRGLEVEGTGANGNVVKADLVAALTAADEAALEGQGDEQPTGEPEGDELADSDEPTGEPEGSDNT